ncbi:MAG: DUF1653 domain-containing protein [Lachnospiraceae bacterium]|nr:DUF1653 domain-containing protein [Lachnospiraceae bacterium]
MRNNPKPYEIYKHFKGNKYQIITLAKDSETGEEMVVYQALYGDYQMYVRPLSMFLSLVDEKKYPEKKGEYRFTKIDGTEENVENIGNTESFNTQIKETELKTKETQPSQAETSEISNNETQTEDNIEDNRLENFVDPMVLDFLDADTYEERLNILAALHHRITDEMINTMAIAVDVEIDEGPVEERYEELKHCLITFQKYQCSRLR